MASKGGIVGGIITLIIGGVAYTISQADIVKNFSKETGLSQEEAQQYVGNITKDDMVPYDKLGADTVSDGESILQLTSTTDCANYRYKWETNTLSCEKGKSQLISYGNDEIALGNAYKKLASESASRNDISSVISLIDKLNADLHSEIIVHILGSQTIDEMRKTNSYNKALLQSALESKR